MSMKMACFTVAMVKILVFISIIHKILTGKEFVRNSLALQWLGLHAFTTEGAGSILGWGTKNLQTAWQPKKKSICSMRFLHEVITLLFG